MNLNTDNHTWERMVEAHFYLNWTIVLLLIPLSVFSLIIYRRLRTRETLAMLVGLLIALAAKTVRFLASLLTDKAEFRPEDLRPADLEQIDIPALIQNVIFDAGLMMTFVGFAAFALSCRIEGARVD